MSNTFLIKIQYCYPFKYLTDIIKVMSYSCKDKQPTKINLYLVFGNWNFLKQQLIKENTAGKLYVGKCV